MYSIVEISREEGMNAEYKDSKRVERKSKLGMRTMSRTNFSQNERWIE